MNSLHQLRQMTTLVADSGDVQAAIKYAPTEATTNPSLILGAAKLPEYSHLIEEAVNYARSKFSPNQLGSQEALQCAFERLVVNFGVEYLKHIPGRVSTQVDATGSYDTEKTVEMAKRLIQGYEGQGITRDRVLIKVAATWEGIEAVKILENLENPIHCNVTLIFSVAQAIASADAGATLISPFVGRILDWMAKKENRDASDYAADDPGVALVKSVYQTLKARHSKTAVMGASFRNVQEIISLAGIDFLTISPGLLKQLESMEETVSSQMSGHTFTPSDNCFKNVDSTPKFNSLNEFTSHMNEMAKELLTDGVRRFQEDAESLRHILRLALSP